MKWGGGGITIEKQNKKYYPVLFFFVLAIYIYADIVWLS